MCHCIIVSHNDAPPDQWNPYLRYALRPLAPVVLLGVTGRSTEAPQLRRQFSVMQWWKAPSYSFLQVRSHVAFWWHC